MKRSWLVVADSSRARIFSYTQKHGAWDLEQEIDHPAARTHTSDLVTDQQGRTRQSGTGGYAPAKSNEVDAHAQEEVKFARELSTRLAHGYDEHAFAYLGMVAPPHFLGLLRKTLAGRVGRTLFLELGKDYTAASEDELKDRLRDRI
ncbi:MAG: host attachment protein [Planctomycetota bacterium]|jgi:protein required for attachment to host cells